MKRLAPLSLLLLLAACGTPGAINTLDQPADIKVFVCKYVGTPGTDERLQTGDNPISVSVNAIPAGAAVGAFFADAQGRSFVLAFDNGQDEPDPKDCPGGDNTTTSTTTTTSSTTSTTVPDTTTTLPPTGGLFAFEAEPLCPDGTEPQIAITFGDRPDLDGQIGVLTFSTGGSIELEFNANTTVPIQYPDSAGTGPVTMTYVLGAESVTRSTTFPEACTTTTTTTLPGQVTTTTTPVPNTFGVPGGTTTTVPGVPPITTPANVTTTTRPPTTPTTTPRTPTTQPPTTTPNSLPETQ